MRDIIEISSRIARRLAFAGPMLVFLVGASAWAHPLSESEVKSSVETWLRHVTADARLDAVVARMEGHQVDGRTVAYVVHLAGGGYCLCGADDLLLPVYLYSPEGVYDPGNPNNQYVLWEMGWRLDFLRRGLEQEDPELEQYRSELSRRASSWQDLISRRQPARLSIGEIAQSGDPVTMQLPLSCRWHQGSPYNDDCPNLTPGQDERTVVGCVATAMAQVMYYWKWPPTGTGTVSTPFPYNFRFTTTSLGEPLATDPNIPAGWGGGRLWWDATGGGTLWMTGYWDGSVYVGAANISSDSAYQMALDALWNGMTQDQFVPNGNLSAPINWGVIQDVHTDPVDDGDLDVAALCFGVGVSVYMHYGVWGSSAFAYHIAEELEEHYYYDADAIHEGRDIARMVGEIQWFRALEISGSGPAGGHSWVAYGYDKSIDANNPRFLMNMGWGDAGIWYTCDQVFPNNQDMTTRIAPLNVKFVGAAGTGDGSPDSPYQNITSAIAAVPDGGTLVFKAGSINTFSGASLVIDQALTLKGYDVTIGQ